MSDTIVIDKPETRTQPRNQPQTRQPRFWNVVLLDDDFHTYDYVIQMTQRLFRMPLPRAFKTAVTVDKQGRAICMTTHKELAELKLEQIHSFGKDELIASCAGAMSAIIEPAAGDDDENNAHDGDRSSDE